jgi:hypothetical protein
MLVKGSATDTDSLNEHVAIEIEMMCELARETQAEPFVATLFQIETRWFEGELEPEVSENMICEAVFTCPMTLIFSEIDTWLRRQYRLRVVPNSWQSGGNCAAAGLVLLMTGRAVPVRVLRRHLSVVPS